MEYLDLKGFELFMVDRDLVEERYRQHFMRWVRRFLTSEFSMEELANRDKIECFADQLARDSSVQDWQLRQALKAVELYMNVYLKEQLGGRAHGAARIESFTQSSGAGEKQKAKAGRQGEKSICQTHEALAKMKKLLRLRRYAYRTEQTYEEWVQRYFKYAGRQGLAWDLPETIRAYLSYLALQRRVAGSTQNQALNAIIFLYRDVLNKDLDQVKSPLDGWPF